MSKAMMVAFLAAPVKTRAHQLQGSALYFEFFSVWTPSFQCCKVVGKTSVFITMRHKVSWVHVSEFFLPFFLLYRNDL